MVDSQNSVRANEFVEWMDRHDLNPSAAAVTLGKSLRMVQLYQAGRQPPLDLLYLMDAIDAGYRPGPMRRHDVLEKV